MNGVELAKRWKTSQPSVSRYMEGRGIPGRGMIKTIAADCGVDAGWLDWGTIPASPGDPTSPDEENQKRG